MPSYLLFILLLCTLCIFSISNSPLDRDSCNRISRATTPPPFRAQSNMLKNPSKHTHTEDKQTQRPRSSQALSRLQQPNSHRDKQHSLKIWTCVCLTVPAPVAPSFQVHFPTSNHH